MHQIVMGSGVFQGEFSIPLSFGLNTCFWDEEVWLERFGGLPIVPDAGGEANPGIRDSC